jgi:hypothetical protein
VIAVASSQRNRGLSHQIPSVTEIRYGTTQGLITLLRQMQKSAEPRPHPPIYFGDGNHIP